MIARLADLRQPPTVGRYYNVPVIGPYPYAGQIDIWPVIGPLHSDADFFDFADLHYHIDARFLTARQIAFLQRLPRAYYALTKSEAVDLTVGAHPLAYRGIALPKGRPRLARRKCRATSYGYAYASQPPVKALRAHYADPAQPVRLADGRLLCPHRKADLTQFPPDAEGIVTCPLHGLRVRCRAEART